MHQIPMSIYLHTYTGYVHIKYSNAREKKKKKSDGVVRKELPSNLD